MIDESRVERVARALCQADGKDPDALSLGKMVSERPGSAFVRRQETFPSWKNYEEEARRFIRAFDAAK